MGQTSEPAEIEIAGRGVRRAVIMVATVAVGAFAATVAAGHAVLELLTIPGMCALSVLTHRGDSVRLRDDALVACTRSGERVFAWGDVLELSWWRGSWWALGAGPVVRLRGGAWDVPGPNQPALVAKIPLFSRGAGDAASRAVRAAAERHGVPWSLTPAVTGGARPPTTRPQPQGEAPSTGTPGSTWTPPTEADGGLPASPFQTRRSREAADRDDEH